MSARQREPIYVRQSFEPDHIADPKRWFSIAAQEAMAEGGVRSRRTIDYGGLLIEVWDGPLPPDMGEPRWQFAPAPKEGQGDE